MSTERTALTTVNALRTFIAMMTAKQFKAERVRRLKMSQTQLADQFGVRKGTVSRWERGVHPIPETAARMMRLLRPMTRGGRAGKGGNPLLMRKRK